MTETALAARARPQAYRVPLYARLFRPAGRFAIRVLFQFLMRVQIEGLENIPKKDPYIIAHNHVSLFEPPLILSHWPVIAEAISAADVWQRPIQNFLVAGWGAIPVRRGEYDRKVLDTMISILQSGRPLSIAPEGGRSHIPGLRRALSGVAYVADRARVPIIPVGISGAVDGVLRKSMLRHRPRIRMHIGKPFTLPPISGRGEERRAARQANSDLVMRHIAAVLPPEYHGIYDPI